MSTTTISLPIIEGIYDIQPLAEPALSFFETALIVVGLLSVICLSIFLIWKYFFSTKAVSKRRLIKLRVNYSENNLTPHDAVYLLCQIMTQGLKLNHIGEDTLLPEKLSSKKEKWLLFIKEISVLRYAKTNSEKNNINNLLKESLYWLKRWP